MKTLITAFLSLVLFSGATPSVHAQGSQWEVLNNEAMSLYQKGQYGRAVMVAKKALDVANKGVGPDHPDVATSLNNLAVLYRSQGQYVQAEPLYQRSLAIREKVLGPEHLDVAMVLENYVDLLRVTKRTDEAAKLEARAQTIRAKHAQENSTK